MDLFGKIKKVDGWQPIQFYPERGDYVKVEWRGKVYEGRITGERPVRFRTGFVAREIEKDGKKAWMPWTSRAQYYVRR